MSNAIIIPPLAMPAVTASSTAAGHDPAYVANDFLGVTWKCSASDALPSITIDLGSDREFDTVALFGLTGAQSNWEMQVVAGTAAGGSGFGGSPWYGPVVPLIAGAVMPTSGRGKALFMAGDGGPPPSRYVRVYIDPQSVQSVTVGRVVIGKRIQLHRNFQFGAAFGVRDLGSFDFSARGVPLRRRGEKLRSVGLTFPHVHRDEIEDHTAPLLERIGNTEVIALVTDPDAHEQRQNRMYLGPMVGDLGYVWSRANGFESRANVVGLDR